MEKVTYITSIPGKYEYFSLEAATGQLEFDVTGDFQILAIRRSDGKPERLPKKQKIDVNLYFATDFVVQTKLGQPTVAEIEFSHIAGANDHSFKLKVIVATLMLDCDADRDGTVGLNEEGKANWTWGEEGRGAMVLVDNDRDPLVGGSNYLDEREPIEIRSLGIKSLPQGVELQLSTAAEGAMKFSIFRKDGVGVQKVIGRAPNEPIQDTLTTGIVSYSGEKLYIAAHEYPGPYFEGLILLNLELVDLNSGSRVVLAQDRIMMRVAPWIMTPNTQPAVKIYTTEITKNGDNSKFLKGLKSAVAAEGLVLEVIQEKDHRGDRWIQDEIEIGYTENHRGSLPVVFDSPRDRGLDDYPEMKMLGPDFGHFVVGGGVENSLDSFGNLEVSPPVVVAGEVFPLGRVIVGGRKDADFSHSSRQMMAEIRQFLYAQKVQFPFELFTDWLQVAHVDEIVCFVENETAAQGFKTLVASPRKTLSILEDLSTNGYGSEILFAGKKRESVTGHTAEVSVDQLLADKEFWKANEVFQGYMDDNVAILQKELGLAEADIVEIPVCFQDLRDDQNNLRRTLAFFPDMVNHLVHKDLSIVPKPYGPIIDGKCAFEEAFEDALPDRRMIFIDDWYSYHEKSGEVHCGTNALRKPFAVSKWWKLKPEGGYDIKTTGI
ncbi:protein-arginine deiminase family protein [Sphingorhabdus sp. Alg231-15]|uniref:protein-arginine deiminase family protein n=1 Tax=Sphingorhabdus sp. Alg231-15 TaxID=1922222 RepID=UPI000D558B7B